MLNARPNMNGNSSESFKTVARNIHSSTLDLEFALQETNEILHGRNYQTVDNPASKRDMDLKRLHAALAAINEIKELAVDIFQAAE